MSLLDAPGERFSNILKLSPPEIFAAGILSIATSGDFLNWNPHVHALIACGVFHHDGCFQVPLLQSNIIQELFEANVFRATFSEDHSTYIQKSCAFYSSVYEAG